MTNNINGIDVATNNNIYYSQKAVDELQNTIKRLQEENKRLQMLSCANCGEKYLSPDGAELYEKNVQLQKENEELKTYIQKMDKPEIKTIDSEIALKNIELQQENEKIKKQYNCYACGNCGGKEDYINLEKHHKGLRKQFDELAKRNNTLSLRIEEVEKENEELYRHCQICENFIDGIPCKPLRDMDYDLQKVINQRDKYIKTLEKIRKVAKNTCKSCTSECDCIIDNEPCKYYGFYNIRELIDEVLNDRD